MIYTVTVGVEKENGYDMYGNSRCWKRENGYDM